MPEQLTTLLLVTVSVIALIFLLLTRVTVRFVAAKADNGWDNAIGYTLVSGLLAFPVSWIWDTRSVLLWILIPPFCWLVQTFALKIIYQVRFARAWLIGMVHAVLTSAAVGSLMMVAGFIAAVILKKKIIADPIYFIKLLLRLIGIELPFDTY